MGAGKEGEQQRKKRRKIDHGGDRHGGGRAAHVPGLHGRLLHLFDRPQILSGKRRVGMGSKCADAINKRVQRLGKSRWTDVWPTPWEQMPLGALGGLASKHEAKPCWTRIRTVRTCMRWCQPFLNAVTYDNC